MIDLKIFLAKYHQTQKKNQRIITVARQKISNFPESVCLEEFLSKSGRNVLYASARVLDVPADSRFLLARGGVFAGEPNWGLAACDRGTLC